MQTCHALGTFSILITNKLCSFKTFIREYVKILIIFIVGHRGLTDLKVYLYVFFGFVIDENCK